MDDELIIKLRKAIELPGETVSELRLREPIVKEFESFQKHVSTLGYTGAMKVLISTVSGVGVAAIEKIGARDYTKAANYLNAFFEESPATGEGLLQS